MHPKQTPPTEICFCEAYAINWDVHLVTTFVLKEMSKCQCFQPWFTVKTSLQNASVWYKPRRYDRLWRHMHVINGTQGINQEKGWLSCLILILASKYLHLAMALYAQFVPKWQNIFSYNKTVSEISIGIEHTVSHVRFARGNPQLKMSQHGFVAHSSCWWLFPGNSKVIDDIAMIS